MYTDYVDFVLVKIRDFYRIYTAPKFSAVVGRLVEIKDGNGITYGTVAAVMSMNSDNANAFMQMIEPFHGLEILPIIGQYGPMDKFNADYIKEEPDEITS